MSDERTTYQFGGILSSGVACISCGMSYADCTAQILDKATRSKRNGKSCCGRCGYTDTHAEMNEPTPYKPMGGEFSYEGVRESFVNAEARKRINHFNQLDEAREDIGRRFDKMINGVVAAAVETSTERMEYCIWDEWRDALHHALHTTKRDIAQVIIDEYNREEQERARMELRAYDPNKPRFGIRVRPVFKWRELND